MLDNSSNKIIKSINEKKENNWQIENQNGIFWIAPFKHLDSNKSIKQITKSKFGSL